MIRLSHKDVGSLLRHVPLPAAWRSRLEAVFVDQIVVSDDEADELRDLVISELDRDGFDEHWEPTDKGLALEELIDVLYVTPDNGALA